MIQLPLSDNITNVPFHSGIERRINKRNDNHFDTGHKQMDCDDEHIAYGSNFGKMKRVKLNNSEYKQFTPNEIMNAINSAQMGQKIKFNDKMRNLTPAATPVEPMITNTDHITQLVYIRDNSSLYSETEDYMVEGYRQDGLLTSDGQFCLNSLEEVQYSLYDMTPDEYEMSITLPQPMKFYSNDKSFTNSNNGNANGMEMSNDNQSTQQDGMEVDV